ncbi:hypothetical protein [Amorphus orientalis]|uniref:Uncharacterized protein n=1 Tax=Amorphus orientalis TaxID=649198 RepID=A0AAE4AS39_9HYPH|nr:hypothetical protein [Amorphus orientalis]MDQ0314610.1 hypothetical protein [Amorphus orientalis]
MMRKSKRLASFGLAAWVVLGGLSYGTPASAAPGKGTTGELLTFDRSAQDYFIRLTMNTAIMIAAQINKEQAQCVAEWYPDDPKVVRKRNTEILRIMEKLPETYPTAVVISIIQKECGKFGQ